MQQAAQAILKRHQVEGLVQVRIEEQVQERVVRASGHRPASMRLERTLHLHTTVDDQAVTRAVRRLGWRVSVTTHPTQGLSVEHAVLASREASLVEHGCGRRSGNLLSLSLLDVQRDQRATGLVRLLALGLRVLTLLEFRVRQRLGEHHEHLAGVSAGNPTRTPQRPTAEALLGAFHSTHVSLVTLGQQLYRHLTPVSAFQQRIVSLLDFSSALCLDSQKQCGNPGACLRGRAPRLYQAAATWVACSIAWKQAASCRAITWRLSRCHQLCCESGQQARVRRNVGRRYLERVSVWITMGYYAWPLAPADGPCAAVSRFCFPSAFSLYCTALLTYCAGFWFTWQFRTRPGHPWFPKNVITTQVR